MSEGLEKSFGTGLKNILATLEACGTKQIGYFIVCIKTGKLYLTSQANHLLGSTVLEAPHYSYLYSFIFKDYIESVSSIFDDVLKNGKTSSKNSFCITGNSTIYTWFECRIQRSLYDSGNEYIIGSLINITEQKYNDMLINCCLDGTYVYDSKLNKAYLKGRIFDVMMLNTGYLDDAENIIRGVIYKKDEEYYKNHMEYVLNNRIENNRIEYRVLDKKGNPMWVSNGFRIIYDSDGRPTLTSGGYIDISELRNYNQFVENTLETSNITGLPNRNRMFKDLNKKAEENETGYMIFINVDDFSNINSTFGYNVGNKFLEHIGNILNQNKPDKSCVYHSEADVFAVSMPEATETQAVEQMVRYKDITGAPFLHYNVNYPYSVSMAAVHYKGKNASPEEVIKKSTIAMKKIKMEGKNNFLVFKHRIFSEYNEKLELENKLRDSVLNGMRGFHIVYQPFINASNSKCIGVEALLRWHDEENNSFPPIVFIPILENTGLINIVDEWVFKNAAKQCKQWIDQGFDQDFYVSVNTTTPQLSNQNYANNVLNYLDEIGLPTKNIVIEITESVIMLDFQRGMKQLNTLKKRGVRLAIDDFGTGYSSLSYLKSLPVDEIKIDRSFIKDIECDSYSREFVDSIIKISQSVGRIICLEGVETVSQMNVLKEMKSDVFQGFLFSRPLEPSKLESLIKLSSLDH